MKPRELGEPDLDERTDRIFETRLPRDRQRLLVTRAHLGGSDALLETIVTGHEQLLNARPGGVRLHRRSLAA